MEFKDLFDNRTLVAAKLKDYLRDHGYTKVSFAKKADISRPTLDKLLDGTVENRTSFERHMQKIMGILTLSAEELVLYHHDNRKKVSAVYSQNAPADHEMSDVAKQQYELLKDILEICTVYY